MKELSTNTGTFSYFARSVARILRGAPAKKLGAALAFGGILGLTPLRAQDRSWDVEVFRDYLIGVFKAEAVGGSWLRDTGQVHDGQYSLKTVLPSGKFLHLWHSWGGAVVTGATLVDFYIYAGNTPIFDQIGIQVTMSNQTGPQKRLSDFATQNVGGWTHVTINKNLLGIGNGRFYAVDFKNFSTSTMNLWFDEIRVDRTVPTTANLNINPASVIRSLDVPMFGAAANVWDERLDDPSTKFRLKEAGVLSMGYPGGTNANRYDWRTNQDVQNGAVGLVDTNTFLKVATNIGAQATISANYGSGTPQDVADWVYYANILKGGNVLKWTIGNENYGSWSYDTHQFQHDAITYAQFVQDAMALMKAVDPRVQVGVTATWSEFAYPQRRTVQNPITGTWTNGWTPVLYTELRERGILPDFIEMHFYPTGPFAEGDNYLLQSTELWEWVVPPAERLCEQYLGPGGDNIPIYLGENNGNFFLPGKQSTSIVNALYLVRSWTKVALQGVRGFSWWNIHQQVETTGNNSPLLYGWREYGDYGIMSRARPADDAPPLNERYPTFFAFKLLKLFARPGDTLVQCSSDNELLSVVAAKSATTGKVKLLISNLSGTVERQTSIRFTNYNPTASMLVYRYGMQEDLAQSDLKVLKLRTPGLFPGAPIKMTFPPYSMTLIEL